MFHCICKDELITISNLNTKRHHSFTELVHHQAVCAEKLNNYVKIGLTNSTLSPTRPLIFTGAYRPAVRLSTPDDLLVPKLIVRKRVWTSDVTMELTAIHFSHVRVTQVGGVCHDLRHVSVTHDA